MLLWSFVFKIFNWMYLELIISQRAEFSLMFSCCFSMMTSHVLTLCIVASLLLVGQYARLLLANEVTTEVPVAPETCSLS